MAKYINDFCWSHWLCMCVGGWVGVSVWVYRSTELCANRISDNRTTARTTLGTQMMTFAASRKNHDLLPCFINIFVEFLDTGFSFLHGAFNLDPDDLFWCRFSFPIWVYDVGKCGHKINLPNVALTPNCDVNLKNDVTRNVATHLSPFLSSATSHQHRTEQI